MKKHQTNYLIVPMLFCLVGIIFCVLALVGIDSIISTKTNTGVSNFSGRKAGGIDIKESEIKELELEMGIVKDSKDFIDRLDKMEFAEWIDFKTNFPDVFKSFKDTFKEKFGD